LENSSFNWPNLAGAGRRDHLKLVDGNIVSDHSPPELDDETMAQIEALKLAHSLSEMHPEFSGKPLRYIDPPPSMPKPCKATIDVRVSLRLATVKTQHNPSALSWNWTLQFRC